MFGFMTARVIFCRGILHGEQEKKHHQRDDQLSGKWLVDTVLGVHEHGITQSDGTGEVVTKPLIRQWRANLT